MRKPVMHENAAGQRENLRFVLQPSESRRENYPVIIPLKIRSIGRRWQAVSGSSVGVNLVEIHASNLGKKIPDEI